MISSPVVGEHVNDSAPWTFPEMEEEEGGEFLKQNQNVASIQFRFILLRALTTRFVAQSALCVLDVRYAWIKHSSAPLQRK